MLVPWKKAMTTLDNILKSRDITLPTKVCLVKAMVFPVVMYGCEIWTIKKAEQNWCFWTVVLEKTLESPLDCKEIQPVNLKRNQCWIFTGRTDAEAPILWPPDAKNWLIGKDSDAGKEWRQEKRMTEEMVGWHHWLNGHECEQAREVGDGQGGLACCSPWGHKESERLSDWTELNICIHINTKLTKMRGIYSRQIFHMFSSSLLFMCIQDLPDNENDWKINCTEMHLSTWFYNRLLKNSADI